LAVVPTVVDDATLLTILARQASRELLSLADEGDVLTTGSWYYRLHWALHDPASTGALSRMASALPAAGRSFLWSTIDDPPHEISVPDPRLVVPVMGSLRLTQRVNHLTAEALAVALAAGAAIRVSVEAPMLEQACRQLDIELPVRPPYA
jgi:hypothetical protein